MREIAILIVEDNISSRQGLARSLAEAGMGIDHVYTAKNGVEALAYLQSLPIDLVITDIRMPEMDGLELLKSCRAAGYLTEFMIVSGFDDFEYAQTAIRYGVKAYFLKPVPLSELKAEIKKMMELWQQAEKGEKLKTTSQYQARELFLQKIIKGDILPEQMAEHCQKFDLPVSGQYLVGVLDCLFFHEDSYNQTPLRQAIIDFFNRHWPVARYFLFQTGSKQFVLLLCLNGQNPGKTADGCRQLCQDLNQHCGHRIYIGVGPIVTDLSDIILSYQAAGRAVSYLLFEPSEKLIWAEDLPAENILPTATQTEVPQMIYQAILNHRPEQIKAQLRLLFDSFREDQHPPHFVRGMCTYIIISVQTELEKLWRERSLAWEEPFSYDVINNLWTISEIHKLLEGLFLSYSNYLQKSHTIIDPIIKKSLFYIKNHLNSPLHISQVANYVHLSPGYFSVYFKNKLNQNFKEYVTQLKIEEAKRLMAAGDLNMEEIAMAVGYDQYRSFHRTFKKETGISPTEYQKRGSQE